MEEQLIEAVVSSLWLRDLFNRRWLEGWSVSWGHSVLAGAHGPCCLSTSPVGIHQ